MRPHYDSQADTYEYEDEEDEDGFESDNMDYHPSLVVESSTSGARRVDVRLNMLDVTDVSLSTHRFTVRFFLEARWEDLEHAIDVTDCGKASFFADNILWEQQFPYQRMSEARRWTPRLFFDNLCELQESGRHDWYKVYVKKPDGSYLPRAEVCYRLRATATFFERFELRAFPFDSQDLQVKVVSMHPIGSRVKRSVTTDSSQHLQLSKTKGFSYKGVVPCDTFLLIDEYEMAKEMGCLEGQRSEARQTSSRTEYPSMTFAVKITRRPNFYLWNVFLPNFLLVALAFPCLVLEVTDLASRLSLIYTLLMAAIAYKNWIGDQLPRCSYVTLVDRYVVLCIILMAAFALESTLVFVLRKRQPHLSSLFEKIDLYEDVIGTILMLAWMGVHIWPLLKGSWPGLFGVSERATQLEEDAQIEYMSMTPTPSSSRDLGERRPSDSPRSGLRRRSQTGPL